MKMHTGQIDVTPETVARLVADQFPEWRHHQVRVLDSLGTVNALFRLGDEIVLRFPLHPSRDPELFNELRLEQDNARRIASQVSVEVPEPLALGQPGDGYLGPWTAYRWIPGETASSSTIGDWEAFACDLAEFVVALRSMDASGRTWNGLSRGGPLRGKDEYVRQCLEQSANLIDTARLAAIWERCLNAPSHDDADVWIHADLMPGNLLLRDGKLAAVIDLGAVCVGDPAVDLMPAWNLMGSRSREVYRRVLGVEDATWHRGVGWAIVQAIGALPYYVDTNPVMAETARRTLDAVLDGSG